MTTMTTSRPEKEMSAPDEASVALFLQENPDFFERHRDILLDMNSPKRYTGDGVVDMQSFLLDRRLNELDELRNYTLEFAESSRSNMIIQARIQAAVLALLRAEDFAQFIQIVETDLPVLLDIDIVSFCYEPSECSGTSTALAKVRKLPEGMIDRILGEDLDVKLFSEVKDDGVIFRPGAGKVRTAAISRLRIGKNSPVGIMALGSRGNEFHAGQETDLVTFLSRVFEVCSDRLLAK